MADSGAAPGVPDSYGAELLDALTPLIRNNTGNSAENSDNNGAENTVLTHVRTEPARLSKPVDWPDWVDPDLRRHLELEGIERPWSHQVTTANHARNSTDVVIATGTASGKSLGYQLAVTDALI
ncbi:MAG: DEAD/DEAH box helicase, partial [Corynebacterium variabile]